MQNELLLPPFGSNSSWPGHFSPDRSLLTFDSEVATDPKWREPVDRLRRWKQRVANAMRILRQEGKEGMEVIQSQELRAHGLHTTLLMYDGSPLPDDLSFWIERHDYFEQEFERIQERKLESERAVSIQDSINPRLERIMDWISKLPAAGAGPAPKQNTAGEVITWTESMTLLPRSLMATETAKTAARKPHRDATEDAGDEDMLSSKRPKRELRQTVARKRRRDATEDTEDGEMLPSKRPKCESINQRTVTQAREEGKGNAEKGKTGKGKTGNGKARKETTKEKTARNETARNKGSDSGEAGIIRQETKSKVSCTARPPLRCSARITALNAAKGRYS